MSVATLEPTPKRRSQRQLRGRKLRRAINRIHLWSALIGSIPALLLRLTGMILAFEPELQRLEERDSVQVKPGENALSLGELFSLIEQQAGSSVTYFAFPKADDLAGLALTADERYHFVNPYDGTILGSIDQPAPVMKFARRLHTTLLMGEAGTWVAIVSSVILMGLCLTGAYLFLKRSLPWRKLFRIRLRKSRYRRNYDIHAVFGFVTALPIALIALSGSLIGMNNIWIEFITGVTNTEFKERPTLAQPVSRDQWGVPS